MLQNLVNSTKSSIFANELRGEIRKLTEWHVAFVRTNRNLVNFKVLLIGLSEGKSELQFCKAIESAIMHRRVLCGALFLVLFPYGLPEPCLR